MKDKKRSSLRMNWIALITMAVFISLLGSTLMLFSTVKSSLYDTFSNGNSVHVESSTREIRMLTERYEKSIEQFAEVVEIVNTHSENVDLAINNLLKEMKIKDQSLLEVYFISALTGNLYNSQTTDHQQDARENEIYRTALYNEATIWTDVRQDETTKKLMVSIATPVVLDDQWYGVVGFDVDLKVLDALRESNEIFGDKKLIIYDNQGIIVSSFMDGMEGNNIDLNASKKVDGALNVAQDPMQLEKNFGWVEEVAEGKRNEIRFQWNDVEYLGEVSFVYSMNWTVVSFVDYKVLNSSLLGFLKTSAMAMAIGLFIGAFLAYYIATQLLKVINNLRAVIFETAKGNLVTEFRYLKNDEIGELANNYNSMLFSIRSLIQKLNNSVLTVERTADGVMQIANENVISGMEVARSTDEIATGASNTFLEVEKSFDAVYHLSKDIGTLIKQSNEIGVVLVETGNQVEKGNIQVDHLESSYIQLEEAVKQVTEVVADLNEKSQSISSISKVISNIAEQTNILSINASIEASRAGQYGRGFAVVANEVRNLAKQAKQSANDIQGTISVVLSQTEHLVNVVSNTNAINHKQKNAISEVSQTIKMMNDSLEKMEVKVEEELQTILIIEKQKEIVVDSIKNILSVSELTTASAQEIASSAEVQISSIKEVSKHASLLVELVVGLKGSVSKFKVEE